MAEPQRVLPLASPSARVAVQDHPPAVPERAEPRASSQPLTPTEKRLRGVLLLGLASTAAVLLVKGQALPSADLLLGSAVLFAGASLLVVAALCRR